MTCVSVIIPAYNQGRFLAQAVNSVFEQTHIDFEIVVVDDGSTDDTRQIASNYADPKFHYVYQNNQGLSAARNTGIRNSTAPYLSFLDSDDLFLPEKLAILGSVLDEDETIGLVAGQSIPIDENNQQVGKIFDSPPPEKGFELLLGNPLHVGSILMRRSWQQVVGFFDESLRSYEDWDMWLRLAQAGCKMAWVDKPVSFYRFHTAQMTRIGEQMTSATFAVLDKLFSTPDLAPDWKAMCGQAYCNAHLRAAAQAYSSKNFEIAAEHVNKAIELDPTIVTNSSRGLASSFRSWIDLPKINQPLEFLEDVYTHLPESASILRRRRRKYLGETAIQLAFEAIQRGDRALANRFVRRAMRYQPKWILNRGAAALFIRSTRVGNQWFKHKQEK